MIYYDLPRLTIKSTVINHHSYIYNIIIFLSYRSYILSSVWSLLRSRESDAHGEKGGSFRHLRVGHLLWWLASGFNTFGIGESTQQSADNEWLKSSQVNQPTIPNKKGKNSEEWENTTITWSYQYRNISKNISINHQSVHTLVSYPMDRRSHRSYPAERQEFFCGWLVQRMQWIDAPASMWAARGYHYRRCCSLVSHGWWIDTIRWLTAVDDYSWFLVDKSYHLRVSWYSRSLPPKRWYQWSQYWFIVLMLATYDHDCDSYPL